MPLSRMRALISLVFLALACTSPSDPGSFTARFELSDINGRSLPTYPIATPGLTPTILSSTIVFDQSGVAKITEHRTESDGTNATYVTNYTYHFAGNELTFDYLDPCPADAICIGPPTGTLVGNRLSLRIGQFGSTVLFYNYRRTQID
jgi:hypothetical protein